MKDVYAKLVAKSWADPEFKAELIKDPKSTLSGEGIKLICDNDHEVVVLENTSNKTHIIIPQQPSSSSEQLVEKDLIDLAVASTEVQLVMIW